MAPSYGEMVMYGRMMRVAEDDDLSLRMLGVKAASKAIVVRTGR